jgi:hypothetical protein
MDGGAGGPAAGGAAGQLEQSQVSTQAFRDWAGTDKVIEPDEINETDFSGLGPFVMRVYHGTTNDFTEFNASIKGTKEGQFGAVNYFTSSEQDAAENYGAEGADLTRRIELRAEQIAADEDLEYDDPDVVARARKEIAGETEKILELFVRTDKPFVIGSDDSPFIEFVDFEALEEAAMIRVADEYGLELEDIQSNREDYEDEIDEARWDIESEEENQLLSVIESVASRYDDIDVQELLGAVSEFATEGGSQAALEELLRSEDQLALATDLDTGDLVGYHALGEIIQELGFDSIILKNADERFEDMNMEPGTAHIHVFDANNTNIKSATENAGAFDPADPNIYRQNTGSGPRGYVEISEDGHFIRLTQASDLSTFIHEASHVFLNLERIFANKYGVTGDQQTILDWLGADSFDEVVASTPRGREMHEKFAETFEVYAREGKAPSLKLRDAFAAFSRWLTQLYKRLTDPL